MKYCKCLYDANIMVHYAVRCICVRKIKAQMVAINREWKHSIHINNIMFFYKDCSNFNTKKYLHRINGIFGTDPQESVWGSKKVINCNDWLVLIFNNTEKKSFTAKKCAKLGCLISWSCCLIYGLQAYMGAHQIQIYDILCIVIK